MRIEEKHRERQNKEKKEQEKLIEIYKKFSLLKEEVLNITAQKTPPLQKNRSKTVRLAAERGRGSKEPFDRIWETKEKKRKRTKGSIYFPNRSTKGRRYE